MHLHVRRCHSPAGGGEIKPRAFFLFGVRTKRCNVQALHGKMRCIYPNNFAMRSDKGR